MRISDWSSDVCSSDLFTADDLRYVRRMKVRAEEQISLRGTADREIKRGPGGIRDIEFAAQLLQLVHGRVDLELRTPHTLPSLSALRDGRYVATHAFTTPAEYYRFLPVLATPPQRTQQTRTTQT